jgi:hypothetical protein
LADRDAESLLDLDILHTDDRDDQFVGWMRDRVRLLTDCTPPPQPLHRHHNSSSSGSDNDELRPIYWFMRMLGSSLSDYFGFEAATAGAWYVIDNFCSSLFM